MSTTPLTRCEELIALAESGEALSTDQRRACVGFIMGSPDHRDKSNLELAKLFKCDEKTIRKDKELVRKQIAEELTKDDVGLVISDILAAYERYVVELAKSKKQATYGTRVWLDYHNAEMQMKMKVTEVLQSLGYYPKNLGTQQVKKFIFKAHVARDGSVVATLPVDPNAKIIDAEVIEPKALPAARGNETPEERAAIIDSLEEEFSGTGDFLSDSAHEDVKNGEDITQ